jgi:hypothetical protein
MNAMTIAMISVILTGFGATLSFDLWGVFLKHAFKVPPSNICLVGRWLRYMPGGVFTHANITATPRKSAECAIGWIAHYMIGISFAGVFIVLLGMDWFQRPTLVPAISFGVITILAPFLIMQPSMGFGFASSKAPDTVKARIHSLMNHVAYGFGLYLSGWLVYWFLGR